MKRFLLFAFLLVGFDASAQVTEDWIRTADVESKYGTALAVDASNNAYVTSHNGSIWLRKYDANGGQLWEVNDTTAVPLNYQFPSRVHVDPQGNAVVVGYRYTETADGRNANAIVVLKYEADGDFVYKKTFTGTYSTLNSNQYWTNVSSEMDASGHLYIGTAGLVDGYNGNNFKVIKLSPTGNIAWVSSQAYATFFYYMNNIRLHGDRIGVIGNTNSANANVAVWMIDTTGAEIYDEILIGVGGQDVAFDNGGNLYALSTISEVSIGDVALYKFDPTGDTLWLKTFDFGGSEFGSRLEFMPDNNLAIMAYGNQQPTNLYSDWITMKVDLNGNLVWSKSYDTHQTNDELPQAIAVDENSNVYVTGIGGPVPAGPDPDDRQMVVIKYSAAGDSLWSAVNDTFSEFNSGVAIGLDDDNGVYALGSDWSILIHFTDTTNTGIGINEKSLGDIVVYPNPAREVVNVALATGDLQRIDVVDVTGKTVYTAKAVGSKHVSIQVDDWHNGIYFLKLVHANGQTNWSKFLKD